MILTALTLLLGGGAWMDSMHHRSTLTVYTPAGFICAVHHAGKLDLLWSDLIIPQTGGVPVHIHSIRLRQHGPTITTTRPTYTRNRSHQATAWHISLPHWLFIAATATCSAVVSIALHTRNISLSQQQTTNSFLPTP